LSKESTLDKEHRPYYVKAAMSGVHQFYANYFLKRHFKSVGRGTTFAYPWNIEVFGPSITVGKYVNIIASPGKRTSITVWPLTQAGGSITIGDYTVISHCARISAGLNIDIGKNCLIASCTYLTDCDWHDIVNRTFSGEPRPIKLEENVWIGDSAIVCKGVTIGKNSVIGAGSVVRTDIPANSVAVGNPARVVRELDPETKYVTRENLLTTQPHDFINNLRKLEREMLQDNTLFGWLRHALFPRKTGDRSASGS
jgi:acetyltransferase-like isoleucine patch superfamily enzyme